MLSRPFLRGRVAAYALGRDYHLEMDTRLKAWAREIEALLGKARMSTFYDEKAAIGRRYRRQDELGTPYCVTIDFDTLDDQAVTSRERDTMEQVRIPIAGLVDWFQDTLP